MLMHVPTTVWPSTQTLFARRPLLQASANCCASSRDKLSSDFVGVLAMVLSKQPAYRLLPVPEVQRLKIRRFTGLMDFTKCKHLQFSVR